MKLISVFFSKLGTTHTKRQDVAKMVSIGIAAILWITVLVDLIIPLVITEDIHLKNPEIVPQITTAENEDPQKKLQDGKTYFW